MNCFRMSCRRVRREEGAVLVISLIVLLVLTLLGVSGMNSSVMQERMAANAQNTNQAFQVAESAVGELKARLKNGDMSSLQEAMKAADSKSTPVDFTLVSGIDSSYETRYLGEIAVTSGSSMDANESTVLLKGYRYELNGTATVDGSGATRTVGQGIEYH